ncbi:MAG: DNA repair protein RecN [Flavobacteriales bacterium]|nr:DNA repair protein RecN [Flavobacteriales bacterium]
MLLKLHVRNYALIDQVDLNFEQGMTAITGETGSGKSILLGALGLVLGERADMQALRSPESKCIVEAIFRLDERLKPLFQEADLDFESESIFRREITPSGKSRAFVNDTPVHLKSLKAIGQRLIDVHSQMETSRLKESSFRYQLLDATAGQQDSFKAWKEQLLSFRKKEQELLELKEAEARAARELDYMQFQFNELMALDLDNIDQEQLENEVNAQRNAEEIIRSMSEVHGILDGSESGVTDQLRNAILAMERISGVYSPAEQLLERLQSTVIEINDISSEAESKSEDIAIDPQVLQELQDQLDGLYALQNKHRVSDLESLRVLRDELDGKIQNASSLESRIEDLSNDIETARQELMAAAHKLNKKREKASVLLVNRVKEILSELKMEHAELRFELQETGELNAFGTTKLSLLFKANKGGQFQDLEKVASGGELSRVMLAIKSSVSDSLSLPTLVLDEIDTGVSGEVAAKMAQEMSKMASHMQVINISHLPQVTAAANQHFKVFKVVQGEETFSEIKMLNEAEREDELASMLSGTEVTEAAREQARSLLKRS